MLLMQLLSGSTAATFWAMPDQSGGGQRRKRYGLRAMADTAFDEAHRARQRVDAYTNYGLRPNLRDQLHADAFLDISIFIDAVLDLSPEVKEKIRQQIAANAEKKTAQRT